MESKKNPKTLQQINTELYADSIEFCPTEPFHNYFICGTYSYDDKTQDKPTRSGKIHLFEVFPNNLDCKKLQTKEVSGVLDLKWSNFYEGNQTNFKTFFSQASSDGFLSLFSLNSIDNSVNFEMVQSENAFQEESQKQIICLSVDWNNSIYKNKDALLCSSLSNGTISLFQFQNESLTLLKNWNAHQYEAWYSHFHRHNPSIIFTGSDDCMFKGWDIRTDMKTPTFINKNHKMGVCAIDSHWFDENLIATGSYDEKCRIFDIRFMNKPISFAKTQGGVWRAKWSPFKELQSTIALACMRQGVQIWNTFLKQGLYEKKEFIQEIHFIDHLDDLSYGIDWSRKSFQKDYFFASCSFYNKDLRFWKVSSNQFLDFLEK
ncbi:diphthine methyltransferase [Anaeramoeba ignava]|uniref:methylated diphthine methylhydrolase n=1 Tax=Anaeramoeba ignava TaxID=1746090 RepID=A0A9Q0LI86_ANAIG|nr:diphthine methyltransferase [Anaeramoeba ignava]